MRLDEARRSRGQATTPSVLPTNSAWRMRRAGVFSSARLAMARAAHSRWLLFIVALGILVADILICTVPLYNTLVADAQLQNTLADNESLARNLQIVIRSQPVSAARSQDVDTQLRNQADQYLRSFSLPQPTSYVKSGLLALNQAGSRTFGVGGNFTEARLEAFDYSAIGSHLRFDHGVAPQTAAAGAPIQVMVTKEMADDFHLSVGQKAEMASLNSRSDTVKAFISGIFEPVNPLEPFWNGFSFAVERTDSLPSVYPVFTTADSFYSSLSPLQSVDMTQNWVYYADLSKITTDSMAAVADNLLTFRSHVTGELQDSPGVADVSTQGSLDQIITNVQRQLSFISLPLYVIAAQIVGLALLFVAAMAGLLIENQAQEIATLKSRGTSGVQLLGIFTAQSALLGLLAAIAGPFLAAGLALLLVRWFLPSIAAQNAAAGGAYFAHLASPVVVIVPAIIGGVLGIAVVTVSALQAARLDVLAFRREMARPTHQPFWRRMYLDIGLALLCLVGYLELGQFGGTNTRLQLGAVGADSTSPLLLLTPALLLLSGGLLLLRVIPLAARLGARLASRGRGLTTLLAFAQIERTPGRYTRMTLLLVLAVGLGLFALTFDASLAENVHDRTAYAAGADVRVIVNPEIPMADSPKYIAHLGTLPGVQDATSLFRTIGSTSGNLGNLTVDMLGIDSTSFSAVGASRSWRSDYASQSLESLMAQMEARRAPSQAVVFDKPMWTMVSDTFAQQLRLKVGDRYQLGVSEIPFTTPTFVVGAIIHNFPTLYPSNAPGGFVIADVRDLEYAIRSGSDASAQVGPNEFWLKTTSDAGQHKALLQALNREQYTLSINKLDSYQEDLRKALANPTNGGMRGLLLIGAITAALLAVLGSLVQAVMAARQRTTQFAVFRTLGMAGRQLAGLLLGEQAVVYLFGLVGGTALGLLLTTATWPFLVFSDSTVDQSTIGVPPYLLRINWESVGIFYAALLLAFVLALAIAARYAATIGLGKALRLGED
jgi:putative ABC transport system permease protein